MSLSTITPKELSGLLSSGQQIEVLDVRTPVEFREVHLSVASNVPLDQLDPAAFLQQRKGADEQPLYVVCKSGARGQKACEKFIQAGFTNVINIEGGTMACEQNGLAVVRGKKAISLERQVRITAGFLVLLGAGLSWFVHPGFVGISAFIGAGLMFAGITDTCGMGMMLAKMPWNQCPKNADSCSL